MREAAGAVGASALADPAPTTPYLMLTIASCIRAAEQAVSDRASEARKVQNALLRSKVEDDSRQEQQTYRQSLRGASEHSGRAVERGPGSGAARRSDARSHSSGASTSAHEQPSSPGQPGSRPVSTPNRHSSTGRNRLQTTSRSSADSSVSAMVQRDASKTSAFLARAETVLASQQQRSDSEPLSPSRSHGVSCIVGSLNLGTARIPDTLPDNCLQTNSVLMPEWGCWLCRGTAARQLRCARRRRRSCRWRWPCRRPRRRLWRQPCRSPSASRTLRYVPVFSSV